MSPEFTNKGNILQHIFQGILSILAVVYTIGFIVVNSYYNNFGITNYELVQSRYIAAGLNYLFIHIALIAVVVYVFDKITRLYAIFLLIIFILVWFLLSFLMLIDHEAPQKIFLVMIDAAFITVVGYQIGITKTGKEETLYRYLVKPSNIFELGFAALALFVIVGFSALVWGKSVWTVENSIFGGGQPNQAVFLFNTEHLPSGGPSLVPMQNARVSAQVPVLFETTTEYVVLVDVKDGGQIAVRLPKDIVLTTLQAPNVFFGRARTLPTMTPEFTPTATTTVTVAPSPTPSPIIATASPLPSSSPSQP